MTLTEKMAKKKEKEKPAPFVIVNIGTKELPILKYKEQ